MSKCLKRTAWRKESSRTDRRCHTEVAWGWRGKINSHLVSGKTQIRVEQYLKKMELLRDNGNYCNNIGRKVSA